MSSPTIIYSVIKNILIVSLASPLGKTPLQTNFDFSCPSARTHVFRAAETTRTIRPIREICNSRTDGDIAFLAALIGSLVQYEL